MYCSHCGAHNIDGGSHCIKCGSRLGHVDDARDEVSSPSPSTTSHPNEREMDSSVRSRDDADWESPRPHSHRGARLVALAIAVALVAGGLVAVGLALRHHERGTALTSASKSAKIHLTGAQLCTYDTLMMTLRIWRSPSSEWNSAIEETQVTLASSYGQGSRMFNAFEAAVNAGFQYAFLYGVPRAQLAETVPIATACGSTHPRTVFGPAPKTGINPTTTSTTSTPLPATTGSTVGSSSACTSEPSSISGLTKYVIPDLLGLGQTGMSFLAPSGFTCSPIETSGGSGGSGGLKSTSTAPAWVWSGHDQASYDMPSELCAYSSYALAAWKETSSSPCAKPTPAPTKVTFLVGSPSSNAAAIELKYTTGGDIPADSPFYPAPATPTQPVFAVLAFDTTQGGLWSFSCSLPAGQSHLCAQDAAAFAKSLHLP